MTYRYDEPLPIYSGKRYDHNPYAIAVGRTDEDETDRAELVDKHTSAWLHKPMPWEDE